MRITQHYWRVHPASRGNRTRPITREDYWREAASTPDPEERALAKLEGICAGIGITCGVALGIVILALLVHHLGWLGTVLLFVTIGLLTYAVRGLRGRRED